MADTKWEGVPMNVKLIFELNKDGNTGSISIPIINGVLDMDAFSSTGIDNARSEINGDFQGVSIRIYQEVLP